MKREQSLKNRRDFAGKKNKKTQKTNKQKNTNIRIMEEKRKKKGAETYGKK